MASAGFMATQSPNRTVVDRRESVTGNLYALAGAFLQQWRSARRTASYASFIIAGIPNVVILAWIAHRSDNPLAVPT